MSEEIVVVVSGGEPPDPRAALAAPLGAPVVAADKGLEHALALGLEVTVAVGDFDSASPEAVAVAEAAGTRVERHPHEKDATDLELALDVAAAMGPERILVLAGDGGRLDHQLAALLLLGSDRYAGSQVDALVGAGTGSCHPRRALVRRSARRARHAARPSRPRGRCDDRRAHVPTPRRDARCGIEPRRLERLRHRYCACLGRARRAAGDRSGRRRLIRLCTLACVALALAGCGGSDETPTEVVLVTHDSFAISDEVKKAFEDESGLTLRILKAGDAGEIVTRALLTAGNPEGDVLFGVDNNLLARALAGDVFEAVRVAGARRGRPGADPRSGASRDADRPRRRLSQLRQGVVRRARSETATGSRRGDPAALPRPARRREPRHVDARTRVHARHDRAVRRSRGRATGASCARTTSSSSTAGRTRTTRASPVPRAAKGADRSSSPMRRALPQR